MNKRMLSRPLGRCVGLDVHLDFIEIAICEEGKVFSAGRVPSTREGIATLADSLLPTDRVALFMGQKGVGPMPARSEQPVKSAPRKKAQERAKAAAAAPG